jgi:hypothetical protein
MMNHASVLAVLVVVVVGGVSDLPAGEVAKGGTPEQIEFFEKRIRPLLVNHCYNCHSGDAKKVKGELFLDTRAGVRKGGASGPAVVLGEPDKSLLIRAVRHQDKDLHMPPKEQLSPAQIADLEAWVKMGAPDPRDGKVAGQPAVIDIAEARKFWSFQPLKSVTPPAVNDRSWPINAIDHFILEKLEAKGLRPARSADKRTLIRRATYDLTGLPPTPEEIEAFLKDNSPAAFAGVIDHLLASPAYGERWGRHWLDVVRYADTAGDNSDYPIPQMHKYRDWVIAAFNRDMPYDRFVREQVAGDLMAAPTEQDRRDKTIATGYLANSRRHGSYEHARYPWYLTIEDTIDNFGKAFLGVTMGCARCHDHKFDPFPAEDYYALYGFFSSTLFPWPGIELDKMQRDLVPLAAPAEVAKVTQARQKKLADMDTAIKRLESDKTALEKAFKAGEKNGPDQVAGLRKEIEDKAQAIKTARKERDRAAKQPLPFETVYAVIDGPADPKKRIGQVGNVRLHVKGDPDRLGKEVPRRFPLVLGGQTLNGNVKGSGRLELAKWLTDPANPLTARVMVNRLWQYHFGRGIVATPNDFGKQGRRPTHPELLDYLAQRFIDSGWSMKQMHRLIMLSRTYQLASHPDAGSDKALSVDPDNDYLWHFARRRLDAESIRDAILSVTGALDRSPGGSHPFPQPTAWDFTQHKPFKAVYDTNRRSVYLMTQRIQRHPFLAMFDGPDTNASTAGRTTSTTPLQALFLMNDPFVHEQARQFSARLIGERSDDSARIERAFLLVFGRPPTLGEAKQAESYLAEARDKLTAAGVSNGQIPARSWESFARVLFMSSEFVYVE